MKQIISIGGFIALALISCNHNYEDSSVSNDSTTISQTNNQREHHNAQNSLDWQGEYEGITPCADCPGIKTTIALFPDQTFKRTMDYLERNSKYEDSGKIFWDEHGNLITLQTTTDSTKYKVEENRLVQLDTQGKLITGDIGKHFILNKK